MSLKQDPWLSAAWKAVQIVLTSVVNLVMFPGTFEIGTLVGFNSNLPFNWKFYNYISSSLSRKFASVE
jgi:hypothetical protein